MDDDSSNDVIAMEPVPGPSGKGDKVFEMSEDITKKNAQNCKNYRERRKFKSANQSLKKKKTNSEYCRKYRQQKKLLAQQLQSENEVLYTPSTSSSQITFEPQPITTDKPIIKFFRRLILNNNSSNTVLTNAQIEHILTKEFHFDLTKMHELEIEIYIMVVKKYLKDWPEWDEFDKTVKKLTAKSDKEALEKALVVRHENLKKFLKTNLDIVKPLSTEWVTKARNLIKETLRESPDASNPESVVLEIKSTREQLNKLIYRYPHPSHNDTIFNAESSAPSHITVNTLSLEEILNWWSVRISLSLQSHHTPCVFVKRETVHESSFALVNKKLRKPAESPERLSDETIIMNYKNAKSVPLHQIVESLNCLKNVREDVAAEGMETIIEYLKRCYEHMPSCYAPADYKQYLSKYPYVRYLYTDVENPKKSDRLQYDIQLKETVRPAHKFSVGRVDGTIDDTLPHQWLKVECISCASGFSGPNLATDLKQHFNEYHQVEPDWECTNCRKKFKMATLAGSWWHHDC